jgi:hypothetical protein
LSISVGVGLIGLAMMACLSPLTAIQLSGAGTDATTDATTRPGDLPPVRAVDIFAVMTFFALGALGSFSGAMGVLRLEPGRKGMILFSILTLLYAGVAILFRLSGGLEDLFASVPVDAPRRSALGAFFVWTLAPLALAGFILVMALRVLTRPEVKRTFRRVRWREPGDTGQ